MKDNYHSLNYEIVMKIALEDYKVLIHLQKMSSRFEGVYRFQKNKYLSRPKIGIQAEILLSGS